MKILKVSVGLKALFPTQTVKGKGGCDNEMDNFSEKKQTKGRSFGLNLLFFTSKCQTSRERPKSASYLKLNNIQGKTQPIVKFSIYHFAESAERAFPETRKHFFLHRKHQKKTNLPLRKIKIFQKRVW